MARLTREEKFRIQEAIAEGNTVKEIAKAFDRTEKTIQKYADEFQELANYLAKSDVSEEVDRAIENVTVQPDEPHPLEKTVAELQAKIDELEQKNTIVEAEYQIQLLDDVILQAIHKLRLAGVKKEDAQFALHKVRNELRERIDDPARLTALCMQKLNAHNNMITEAMGGREGIAVMTSTASQIMDEQAKHRKKPGPQRIGTDKCLFNPKTGETR